MTPELWQKVEDVFAGAAELLPSEIPDYLDHECQGDADLRKEVEAMLAYDVKDQNLIQNVVEQAAEHIATTRSGMVANLANRRVGTRIGPYRLDRVVGTGGMGVVYLAVRDDNQFTKNVAIKLVQSGREVKFVLDRFRQERQILAQLDHPNIARFIDGGLTPDGLPYYVMEYVEDGEAIVDYCRKRDLSLFQRLNIFLQVCSAVNYAHRNLVVHRDLKPGNILVDRHGVLKLLDFGIAKVIDADGDAQRTRTVVRMLTPDYASPEQVLGQAITTASDVYSLGAILYELLAEAPAHRFHNYSPTEIERVVCRLEPTLPSTAILQQDRTPQRLRVAKLLAGDLDSIVSVAMRKEPKQRYQSVEQLIDDIERFIAGQPVVAHKATLFYRAAKFAKRNRFSVVAAAVLLITMVGGVAASAYMGRRAERRFQQMKQLTSALMGDFEDRAKGLPQSTELREWLWTTMVRHLDDLATETGDEAMLQDLAQAHMKLASLEDSGNQASHLGRNPKALENYRKALEILERLRPRRAHDAGFLALSCGTLRRLADSENAAGDVGSSRNHLERALQNGAELVSLKAAEGHECLADAYSSLAATEMRASNARGAIPHVSRELDQVRELQLTRPGAASERRVVGAMLDMAWARLETGNPEAAMQAARDAVAKGEASYAGRWNQSHDRLRALETMGDISGNPRDIHLNRPAEASGYYEQALAMAETALALEENDVRARRDVNRLLRKLALMVVDANPERALGLCNRAVPISEALVSKSPKTVSYMRDHADGVLIVGYAVENLGRVKEAMGHYEKTLALQTEIRRMSPDLRRVRREMEETLSSLGDSCVKLGLETDAMRYYEKAREITVGLLWDRPTDAYLLRDLTDLNEQMAALHGRIAKRGGPQAKEHWKQAQEFGQKSLDTWLEWPKRFAPGEFAAVRAERARKLVEEYRKAAQ
ncbi:MAG: protein kinase [Acidobacteria bacterium]|nr:protein kinase [Acidobacteriota bacterium]